MKTLKTIIDQIETFAPPSLAPFDFVGLLQGDLNQPIKKIGITLDYSLTAIQKAIDSKCDLLITHHGPTEIQYPLRGNLLKKIELASQNNLNIYRCHLNLDFCSNGIIENLCKLLNIPAKPQHTQYHEHHIFGGVYLAEEYPLSLSELLERIKVLGINSVRIAGPHKKKFSRIAITSGQGFISEFFDQLKPDIYIAGEFEQEATKYAEDLGIMLVELTHHASEVHPLERISETFSELFDTPVELIEVPDTIVACPLSNSPQQ